MLSGAEIVAIGAEGWQNDDLGLFEHSYKKQGGGKKVDLRTRSVLSVDKYQYSIHIWNHYEKMFDFFCVREIIIESIREFTPLGVFHLLVAFDR